MKKLLFLALFTSLTAHAIEWKSLFISGDHSIPNFDNGRKTLSKLLAPLGAYEENQIHLTSDPKEVSENVYFANQNNFFAAFSALKVDKKKDGCFIFMTSHGVKGQGFYLSQAGVLPPQVLSEVVDATCGEVPTVLLISACYSGQFIKSELAKDNRVILTAAISDRPSFGCSTDTEYTYWDECVIDSIPHVNTWEELYADVKTCISGKESSLGFQPSLPQGYFGKSMQNQSILNK